MLELLNSTKSFINSFSGIRISTRPDCIDDEILAVLKEYGVTSIELGAQSMDNSVLELNNRGHNAEDVVKASKLIKDNGFSLGLQMMTCLYGSDFEKDIKTAESFIALKPDTVRIYPTVIMKNTALADLYTSGQYNPYTLDESVDLCAKLIMMFESANIKVIRLGLHYSDSLVNESLGNNYHPAFKELCEAKIFYNSFLELSKECSSKELDVFINQKSLSKFLGLKKSNLKKFNDLGYDITVNFDNDLSKYELKLRGKR
jgi:histone acetyltransferase (RNA polymerase elongator complex component)